MNLNLIGISGSLRAASYNSMLVREAARAFGDCNFEMADIRFPLFDEDLEATGIPAKVTQLADEKTLRFLTRQMDALKAEIALTA